eukprot:4668494-Pleurochrysis_carterae.AAC.4
MRSFRRSLALLRQARRMRALNACAICDSRSWHASSCESARHSSAGTPLSSPTAIVSGGSSGSRSIRVPRSSVTPARCAYERAITPISRDSTVSRSHCTRPS